MNREEFEKVHEMTYREYCKYLQDKYGLSKYNYYTEGFSKNAKASKTKEGLALHHIDEDKMIMLSTKEIAEACPYEWQTKEHLVYCDLLEHLLLHVLICYYPSPEQFPEVEVGVGGAINFLIPELNDVYCGWETKQEWRKAQHDKIYDDSDVYLLIIAMLIPYLKKHKYKKKILHSSLNEAFGVWSREKNKDLYKVFNKMWGWWPFW